MDQPRYELSDLLELLVRNSHECVDTSIGGRERCFDLLLLFHGICKCGLYAEPTCSKRLKSPTLSAIAAMNLSGTPLWPAGLFGAV